MNCDNEDKGGGGLSDTTRFYNSIYFIPHINI